MQGWLVAYSNTVSCALNNKCCCRCSGWPPRTGLSGKQWQYAEAWSYNSSECLPILQYLPHTSYASTILDGINVGMADETQPVVDSNFVFWSLNIWTWDEGTTTLQEQLYLGGRHHE